MPLIKQSGAEELTRSALVLELGDLKAQATRIKEQLSGEKGKTLIPGDELVVDFSSGMLTWRGESFRFAPLGEVPQGLVVAGGVENQVRQKLSGG